MMENAPHLTRRLEVLVPSYHWVDVAYLDIGLKIYDWLAGPGRISPSKVLSRDETLERMPQLNPEGLVGSVAYADGQFDRVQESRILCCQPKNPFGRSPVFGSQVTCSSFGDWVLEAEFFPQYQGSPHQSSDSLVQGTPAFE